MSGTQKHTWQDDWQAFVHVLAKLFATGTSIRQISAEIADRQVHWTGRVTGSQMRSKFAPGVTVDMPLVQVKLDDGRVFEGEHVGLTIKDAASCRMCIDAKEYDEIEFCARIQDTKWIRPPVEFVNATLQQKVLLVPHLKEVKVVRRTVAR